MDMNEEHTHTQGSLKKLGKWVLVLNCYHDLDNHDEHIRLINSISLIHKQQHQNCTRTL